MARVIQSTPIIYAKRKERTAFHNEPVLLFDMKSLDAIAPSTTNKDHDNFVLENGYLSFEKGLMRKVVPRAGVDLPLVFKCESDLLSTERSEIKTKNAKKGNCLSELFSISDLEELDSKGKFHTEPQDSINTGYGSSYPMSVDESHHCIHYDRNHGNSSNLQNKRKKNGTISTSEKDSSSEDEGFKRKLLHKKRMYKAMPAVTPTSSEYSKENVQILDFKDNKQKGIFSHIRMYSSSESDEGDLIDEIFNFSAFSNSSSPQNILSEIQPTFSNVVYMPNTNSSSRNLDNAIFRNSLPTEVIMARLRASEKIQEVGLSRNFRKKCTLNRMSTKYPPKRKIFWRKQFKNTKRKNYRKWKKVSVGPSQSTNGVPRQLRNSKIWTEFASGTKSWRKNASGGVLNLWENKDEINILSLEHVPGASSSFKESACLLFSKSFENIPFTVLGHPENTPQAISEKLENMSYSVVENSESIIRSVYANPEKMFQSVLENKENMSFSVMENLENMSFETADRTDILNARKC